MNHEWIIAVLEDLCSYAAKNNLHATASKAQEALTVAQAEVSFGNRPASGDDPQGDGVKA